LLPTTTIGSFPQTKEIRSLRYKLKKGTLTLDQYNAQIDIQIGYAIGVQEALGLDILVHGEAERTDMVEFFAQQMDGMLFTSNGWVQSFGSRCVRPPIVWADVSRPKPMTTREFEVAKNLTEKPVKGMLTGPVTILNWSFPRVDVSRKEQAMQLALALRDEIADLEKVGCTVVQVDEPALREAMPLRASEKDIYLTWTVDAFRLATAGASSETQIHTHMCYCEFGDCMDAIDCLDTDVNSIENARSDNATLIAFRDIGYSKGLGPGTYDIHSPVIPTEEFILHKIESFLACIPVERLVINPDCGLKTRTWEETIGALKNMVAATHTTRARLGVGL
jgi:5-methyltetrahydropteroyltriglutamate--homocysteine methyltransferase